MKLEVYQKIIELENFIIIIKNFIKQHLQKNDFHLMNHFSIL